MATQPKKSFQLVNWVGQKPLDIVFGESNPADDRWYFCDWDTDGNGNIRTIKQQEYVVQSSLKCIFTEKQQNGYGTNIFDLVGEKDISVKRVSLLIDITMAMMAMKLFADAQASRQELTDEDLIAAMTKFVVTEDENDPSISKVKMSLATVSGAQTEIGVL